MTTTRCFLRLGDDTLDEAVACGSLKDAEFEFAQVAQRLDRYGQTITATIHIAGNRSEVVEDPDYFLELGPLGGVRRTRM